MYQITSCRSSLDGGQDFTHFCWMNTAAHSLLDGMEHLPRRVFYIFSLREPHCGCDLLFVFVNHYFFLKLRWDLLIPPNWRACTHASVESPTSPRGGEKIIRGDTAAEPPPETNQNADTATEIFGILWQCVNISRQVILRNIIESCMRRRRLVVADNSGRRGS